MDLINYMQRESDYVTDSIKYFISCTGQIYESIPTDTRREYVKFFKSFSNEGVDSNYIPVAFSYKKL